MGLLTGPLYKTIYEKDNCNIKMDVLHDTSINY
jgi:hypothetical protein